MERQTQGGLGLKRVVEVMGHFVCGYLVKGPEFLTTWPMALLVSVVSVRIFVVWDPEIIGFLGST